MLERPQDLLSVLGVPSQLKTLNLDCLAPGKSMDTHIVGVCDKDHKGPLHTLDVLSLQVVLSHLKMSNLDCWGPGESADTHTLGACNTHDIRTSGQPQCPWESKMIQKKITNDPNLGYLTITELNLLDSS